MANSMVRLGGSIVSHTPNVAQNDIGNLAQRVQVRNYGVLSRHHTFNFLYSNPECSSDLYVALWGRSGRNIYSSRATYPKYD